MNNNFQHSQVIIFLNIKNLKIKSFKETIQIGPSTMEWSYKTDKIIY